jgi:cell division protein FtsB
MKQFLTVILTSCLILIGTSAMTVKAAEQVYGWQLMTQQERNEYRAKMQTLKTAEERERYRLEHHKMMQERAKERGVTLPEVPGPHGKSMGPGKAGAPGKCGGGGNR